MPTQVQDMIGRLTGGVRQLSLAQRTFALIGIAALVLGAVALSSWMARPTLTPLFSGLSGPDASAVVDELGAAGVTYELADGGSTVLVPAGVVYEQRVRMAAAGLPADTDGAGYSLLDQMPMTASEFQQETTYLRALEGELSRTVGAIDGVEAATVRLAIPEETVFVAETADPTASVFVRSRRGTQLTSDQVQAITHLVSAGVDGMEPSQVAVVDASGAVLSAVGETPGAGAGSDSQAADYETRVGGAVQNMLDRLVGAGRATVTVNAQLDLTQSERTTEQFDATADTPPLASSTTTEEYTGTGAGGGATGVLGPDNIAVPDGANGAGTYTSTSEDVTNAVNKSTEVVRSAGGALERQSVSVLVDEAVAGALDMADLQAAVAAAAGIDTERGDTLSVQRMAFDATSAEAAEAALAAADKAAAAEQQQATIRQLATAAGIALLVVVVLIVIGVRSRRARREALDIGQLDANRAPVTLGSLEAGDIDDLPILPPAPEPVEPDGTAVRRAEIAALADEQPEQVAELLRGWMTTGANR